VANWNQCTLAGNLTADPELKFSTNGTQFCNFTVAYNEWRAMDEKRTHFFRCVAFGKVAERLCKLAGKGANVLVGGSLSQDRWEDKETKQQRSEVKLLVMNLQLLGAPRKATDEQPAEIDAHAAESAFVTEDVAPF
jgi:single-strand DNA-binding protein